MAQTSTGYLNVRIPAELARDLDEISQAEQLDRASVVKRLLRDAIQRWKLDYALRLYREERVTKERAAEIAGVSLYEIMEAAHRQGIPAPLTVSETLEEVERLLSSHHSAT